MTTTPLVVVVHDTTECDGCRIQATITTDGLVAAAATSGGLALSVSRTGTLIHAECPLIRNNVPCHGWFEWDLSNHETWKAADHIDRAVLTRDAVRIES